MKKANKLPSISQTRQKTCKEAKLGDKHIAKNPNQITKNPNHPTNRQKRNQTNQQTGKHKPNRNTQAAHKRKIAGNQRETLHRIGPKYVESR